MKVVAMVVVTINKMVMVIIKVEVIVTVRVMEHDRTVKVNVTRSKHKKVQTDAYLF